MMPEWVYWTVISALWAVTLGGAGWIGARLTRAIDRLADSTTSHAIRLAKIETKLNIQA